MGKKQPESPSCKPGDNAKPGDGEQKCILGELIVFVKNEDGAPVEAVEVSAGALGKKNTDKDGKADYGKVKPGTYDVTAAKPGHAPKRGEPVGPSSQAGVAVPESGKTTVNLIQHPSCANVAFFEGATTRSKYFGFDHKTNMVVTAGTDEYWLPTPAKGALAAPADKFTRDAARWVSVAVGKETEVEINFAFKPTECIPCIANSSFKVEPAGVADVVTASVTTKKAAFKIKGKAAGEASLKVSCDGKDIGWFHIWSQTEATLKIDVVNVVTTRAPENAWSLASLRTAFDEIFRQAALKIDIADLGKVDLSADAAFKTVEDGGYPAVGVFLDKNGSPAPYSKKATILSLLHTKASALIDARAAAPLKRAGAYRIYRYVPTASASIGGTVLNIGASPAFTFMSDGASARNSIAHEFGHCLGLFHPGNDDTKAQTVAHNHATLNTAVPAYAATNTEIASVANAAHWNIMANDPTNLMGYWPRKADRKPLRYHQWKAISRSPAT